MKTEKFIFLKPPETVQAEVSDHLPHAPVVQSTEQKTGKIAISYPIVALFIVVPNALYFLAAFLLSKSTLPQFFNSYMVQLLTERFSMAADTVPTIGFLQWLLITQSFPYEVMLNTELGDANVATTFGIFCYPFIMLAFYRIIYTFPKIKLQTAQQAVVTAAVISIMQGALLAALAFFATKQAQDQMGEYIFHFPAASVFVQAVLIHFIVLIAVYFWHRDLSLEANKLLGVSGLAIADFVKFVTVVYIVGIAYATAMEMDSYSPATMSMTNYFWLNGVYVLLLALGGKLTLYNYGQELHFQLYGAEKWTGEIPYIDSVYGLDYMSVEIGLMNIAEHAYTSILQVVLALFVMFFFIKAAKKLTHRSVKETLRYVAAYTVIFVACLSLLPRFSQRGDFLHFSSPEGLSIQLPLYVLLLMACTIGAIISVVALIQAKRLVRK